MKILTLDNLAFDLNNLPEDVDDSLRFSVLDNSDPSNPDFFFIPLIFLESFNSPAMVLRIGDEEVSMPIDWSIAVGDSSSSSDIEILPLTSLNDRGFEAFCFNPLSSFRIEFKPIEKQKSLEEIKNPKCIYCNCKLNPTNATTDHIIPISKGGNNTQVNLMVCCIKCNGERGDMEFYQYIKNKNPKFKNAKRIFI
jgi:hypothetical protein